MTFEDLFLVAIAIGLGFNFAKEYTKFFFDWLEIPWQERKSWRYIFEGIFLFLFLVYLAMGFSSRQLF